MQRREVRMDWSFVEWLMSLNCRELIGEKTIKYSMIIIYVWGWRMRKGGLSGCLWGSVHPREPSTDILTPVTSSLIDIYDNVATYDICYFTGSAAMFSSYPGPFFVQYQCPIVYETFSTRLPQTLFQLPLLLLSPSTSSYRRSFVRKLATSRQHAFDPDCTRWQSDVCVWKV